MKRVWHGPPTTGCDVQSHQGNQGSRGRQVWQPAQVTVSVSPWGYQEESTGGEGGSFSTAAAMGESGRKRTEAGKHSRRGLFLGRIDYSAARQDASSDRDCRFDQKEECSMIGRDLLNIPCRICRRQTGP